MTATAPASETSRGPAGVLPALAGRAQLAAAALSITLAGRVLSDAPLAGAVLPGLAALLLVAISYGFNVVADEAAASGARLRLSAAWAATLGGLTLALSIVLARLPFHAALAAGGILVVGVGYSLTVRVGGRSLRVRNTYLLKNLSIAFAWALLVPLGAPEGPPPMALLTLVFGQVFIGSVLRDVSDAEADRAEGVASLVVRHGVVATLALLLVVNAVVGLAVSALAGDGFPWLLTVVLWRFALLAALLVRARTSVLLQFANLATCHVVLFAAELSR